MANIANPSYSYTFNGDVNKRMFIDPALKNPDILSLFSVENNVNYKKQLLFNFDTFKCSLFECEEGASHSRCIDCETCT